MLARYGGEQVESAAVSPYQQRLEQGACTYGRCKRAPADGSDLCRRHLRKRRKRQAEWFAAKSARRITAKLCVWCPESGPPRPADGPGNSCKQCRVRRNRIRDAEHGAAGVDNRTDRIASRTKKHADGRTRYHGQPRRGGLAKSHLNRQDIELARECFDTLAEGLQMIETDDVKRLPRIQRDGVVSAVAHQGDRTVRHLEDILERLGHFKLRHGKRDGE